MALVVDFSSHVFPNRLGKFEVFPSQWFAQLKSQARHWAKPIANSIHEAQTVFRYLPKLAKESLDSVGTALQFPSLLIESTRADLLAAMNEAQVNQAVIIAQPPYISNEFVLALASENLNLIPVVRIPKTHKHPKQALKSFVRKGARALKIHPALEGEGVSSSHYQILIRAAGDYGLPVIIHTGHIQSRLFYRSPQQGRAENFVKWFKEYPKIQFILAHMNMHEPNIALSLCEQFSNLWVDTACQPAEMIGEAVRRIGPERVLFATDWPFIGNNMLLGRQRIQKAVEAALLTHAESELILGENALKLLGSRASQRR
jgi:predicted TIM-barrel fold metal-dependent hydrolase